MSRLRRGYEGGPDCTVCGFKNGNVVHDSPEVRAANTAPGGWAASTPTMPGGYYKWADVPYHPFTTEPNRVHTHLFRCACGAVR